MATCIEKGYSGNQYCTVCDRIAQKGVPTPSLHEIAGNYSLINKKEPGCTTVGYSGDFKCTGDCGQISAMVMSSTNSATTGISAPLQHRVRVKEFSTPASVPVAA